MKRLLCLGALLLVASGSPGPARAAEGDLDASFGRGGMVTSDLGGLDSAGAVALMDGGKTILVAGSSGGNLAFARFNSFGQRDTTFGGTGIVSIDLGSTTDRVTALAIQPNRSIVAAGNTGSRFAIVRLLPDGALDRTFSGGGILIGSYGAVAGTHTAAALGLDTSGRIVVAGEVAGNVGVARFTLDGTPDFTFSGDGVATLDLGSTQDRAAALGFQSSGRIIVAASTLAGTFSDFALVAVSPTTGEPVQLIASGLSATTDFFGGSDTPAALAIQADDRIVVAGVAIADLRADPNGVLAVARYEAGGRLDQSFDGDGRKAVNAVDGANAVGLQADGKIVATGQFSGASGTDIHVVRLLSTGATDNAFSGDGVARTTFGNAVARGVTLQPADGRIVVAGTQRLSGSIAGDFALARFHAFSCNGQNVTLVGGSGADSLLGSSGTDAIHGLGGNDVIDGRAGNDHLCGGTGANALLGNTGDDTLLGGTSRDSHDGGDGKDVCAAGDLLGQDSFIRCETVNTGSSGLSGQWLEVDRSCNASEQNPLCVLRGALEVSNPGTESTAVPALVSFYLSHDDVLDEGDVFLTTREVAALDPGADLRVHWYAQLHEAPDPADAVVIAVLDPSEVVAERNEDNNLVVSPLLPE